MAKRNLTIMLFITGLFTSTQGAENPLSALAFPSHPAPTSKQDNSALHAMIVAEGKLHLLGRKSHKKRPHCFSLVIDDQLYLACPMGDSHVTKKTSLMKIHINAIHLKLRPHLCSHQDCSRSTPGNGFGRLDELKRHVNTKHLDKRPFVCKNCNRDFGRFDNLRRHIRIYRDVGCPQTPIKKRRKLETLSAVISKKKKSPDKKAPVTRKRKLSEASSSKSSEDDDEIDSHEHDGTFKGTAQSPQFPTRQSARLKLAEASGDRLHYTDLGSSDEDDYADNDDDDARTITDVQSPLSPQISHTVTIKPVRTETITSPQEWEPMTGEEVEIFFANLT